MGLAELVPWRPHPEVWVLVAVMLGGYWIAVRRLAPYYAPRDKPAVSRIQIASYLGGVAVLCPVSDSSPPGPRLWGLDEVTDQQIAGLLMKLGGGVILWTVITVTFFRWAAAERVDAPGFRPS